MLTGQAKTDYQREYMRKRRSNKIPTVRPADVRPEQLDPVRPNAITVEKMIQCVADVGGEYSHKTVAGKVKDVHRIEPPKPQSHSPMMVGYVPPKV